MVKLSLTLPDDVKKVMDRHREVKWEEIAQEYLWEYAKKIELTDRITAGSKLTEEEAHKISGSIRQGLASKYGK